MSINESETHHAAWHMAACRTRSDTVCLSHSAETVACLRLFADDDDAKTETQRQKDTQSNTLTTKCPNATKQQTAVAAAAAAVARFPRRLPRHARPLVRAAHPPAVMPRVRPSSPARQRVLPFVMHADRGRDPHQERDERGGEDRHERHRLLGRPRRADRDRHVDACVRAARAGRLRALRNPRARRKAEGTKPRALRDRKTSTSIRKDPRDAEDPRDAAASEATQSRARPRRTRDARVGTRERPRRVRGRAR